MSHCRVFLQICSHLLFQIQLQTFILLFFLDFFSFNLQFQLAKNIKPLLPIIYYEQVRIILQELENRFIIVLRLEALNLLSVQFLSLLLANTSSNLTKSQCKERILPLIHTMRTPLADEEILQIRRILDLCQCVLFYFVAFMADIMILQLTHSQMPSAIKESLSLNNILPQYFFISKQYTHMQWLFCNSII
ncbi:hypothetical protein FGO68_gene12685 [Halteria grandinella]|uniref:Transmembrane protein n=1 Tax=Halteria grandinella TaxID=5974 RepID=A0A8J8P1S7_HALGN|nr:hypothetical protein FGO68_gene12685 [Halteria grandinella]